MARTVTVALGQHYEEFIQANIAGGRYNNASEVVRAALRRLEEDEARLAALCAAEDTAVTVSVTAVTTGSVIE